MAFVDLAIPYATAAGSVSAQVGGAPQGGGVSYSQMPQTSKGQPGAGAPGTDASLRVWIIAFFVIDAVILIAAGVIFNGKGS